jgi:hypothetical protein
MDAEKQTTTDSLSPLGLQDLDRPLSAKLFLWVIGTAISALIAALGVLVSTGQSINHQLDSMKDEIGEIRPRVESIDKKLDGLGGQIDKKLEGLGGQFQQHLDRVDQRIDTLASARVAR